MHTAPHFTCWLQDGGRGCQGEAVRQKSGTRVLPCNRLLRSPKNSSAKPGDEKTMKEMPASQICGRSV